MKIGIVDVFVDDQDRAGEFYTAMLGKRTDAAVMSDEMARMMR
jgi:catechol 2,3-dioxygenase-like lactoylglutathione lyase family enzyme